MKRGDQSDENTNTEDDSVNTVGEEQSRLRLQILCIVTAFDLLSGQGEQLLLLWFIILNAYGR